MAFRLPEGWFGDSRHAAWRRTVVRRWLAVGLVGCAVAAAAPMLRASAGADTRQVVVAARPLLAGARVGAGDVTVARRPADQLPGDAVTATEQVVGRRVAGPVSAAEVLTPARVVGGGLVERLPAGQVAMHLAVADPASLAFVSSGDVVDVLAPGVREPVAAGALVLAVAGKEDAGGGVLGGTVAAAASGVLLALPEPDTRDIAAGQNPVDGVTGYILVVQRPG